MSNKRNAIPQPHDKVFLFAEAIVIEGEPKKMRLSLGKNTKPLDPHHLTDNEVKIVMSMRMAIDDLTEKLAQEYGILPPKDELDKKIEEAIKNMGKEPQQ